MWEAFDWDESNRNHVAEHGVTPEEAEQAVSNDPFELPVQYRNREQRFPLIGQTDAGRVLFVVTAWRGKKIRVVTAFPANKKYRDLYEQQEEASAGGSEDP